MKKIYYLAPMVLSLALVACGTDDDSGVKWDVYNVADAPTFIDGNNPLSQDSDYDGKVWSPVEAVTDEFNVDGLNAEKWTADPEANGWAWLGRAPQLFDPNSVTVKDGTMQILVGKYNEPIEKESYGNMDTYEYHGGIVRSTDAYAKKGYYYECRLKMGKTEMGGGFWLNVHPTVSPQRHEIDIQESVGCESTMMTTYQQTVGWDSIMHSNAIDTTGDSDKDSDYVKIPSGGKTCDDFHIYGAWWKDSRTIMCYLDGKYVYTIEPPIGFSLDSYVQFSIEMYDWNEIPSGGGQVASLPEEDRIYHYDWVRVWEVVDAPADATTLE